MNTLPGMTATSLVPKSAIANNLSFKRLIDKNYFIEHLDEIRLFNSLNKKKEIFKAINSAEVGMYMWSNGVHYAHLGNFRTFIFEDLLKRWLATLGTASSTL